MSFDFSEGKELNTDNPYDVAILGPGFFAVRSEGEVFYTRQGQFRRNADGQLVTDKGYVLQAQGGGDLALKGQDFKVLEDGAVLDGGQPIGRLGVVDFADHSVLAAAEDGLFSGPAEAAVDVDATVQQGRLEASNVSTGDEMIAIMESLRRAEAGQRMVNVYDDLMGRVLSTFGQV